MSILLDGKKLPDEMIWQDEHEWTTVRASPKRTVQGKHIVRENLVPSQSGRTITLGSDYAWLPREDVLADNILGLNTLRDWSDELGKQMTLVMHDSRVILVRFRHWDVPAIIAEPLIQTAFPDADTNYNLQLKLAVV